MRVYCYYPPPSSPRGKADPVHNTVHDAGCIGEPNPCVGALVAGAAGGGAPPQVERSQSSPITPACTEPRLVTGPRARTGDGCQLHGLPTCSGDAITQEAACGVTAHPEGQERRFKLPHPLRLLLRSACVPSRRPQLRRLRRPPSPLAAPPLPLRQRAAPPTPLRSPPVALLLPSPLPPAFALPPPPPPLYSLPRSCPTLPRGVRSPACSPQAPSPGASCHPAPCMRQTPLWLRVSRLAVSPANAFECSGNSSSCGLVGDPVRFQHTVGGQLGSHINHQPVKPQLQLGTS